MSEHDVMIKIHERLGRIEAKIDDINSIRSTADEAYRIAERAEQRSTDNSNDIERLGATIKWGVGITVTISLFVLGKIFI